MKNLFRLWQSLSIPIFILALVHLLKDITQDVLQIATFLDKLGNINENLSNFSEPLLWFYHWAMVNTYFMELFIVLTVLQVWRRKAFTTIDYLNTGFVLYITVMFTIALLLQTT